MYQYIPLIILLLALPLIWYFYTQKKNGNGVFTESSSSVLSKYSRDLNRLASEKKIDPVIGREKEISRVIQILSRRNKNNPVLVGSAGIGKTAIVEGLAEAIINKKVPPILDSKRVLALDLTGILAGTKYRGEFEQRLKKIVDEIANSKRAIILFIDEIHILAEAGQAEGAINAADILKPLLARGELQVVGATTKEEYEQFIKKDKTLDRRLQPVFVYEPDMAQTRKIIEGIAPVYEKYHGVKITPQAITESIRATKFLKNRSYPDKAIDAIDESCSKVHIDSVVRGSTKRGTITVTGKDVLEVIQQWKQDQ